MGNVALRAPNNTPSCSASLDTCLRRYDTIGIVIPVETGIQRGGTGAPTTRSRQFCYAPLAECGHDLVSEQFHRAGALGGIDPRDLHAHD